MGNFFAQPEESKYPETLDQEGVLKILTLLGNVQGPTVDNNPAEITNPRFNSYCPLATHLSEISVSDPEILNETLETIADSIIEKLSSAEKVEDISRIRNLYSSVVIWVRCDLIKKENIKITRYKNT